MPVTTVIQQVEEQVEEVEHGGGASENLLRAEIDRLRAEVDRLNLRLREERMDRAVRNQVHTVLSTLSPPVGVAVEPAEPASGRLLDDGRVLPDAVAVPSEVRPAEAGAPRTPTTPEWEFSPGDEAATAFDNFFNAPDPHLEKIRRFLIG